MQNFFFKVSFSHLTIFFALQADKACVLFTNGERAGSTESIAGLHFSSRSIHGTQLHGIGVGGVAIPLTLPGS